MEIRQKSGGENYVLYVYMYFIANSKIKHHWIALIEFCLNKTFKKSLPKDIFIDILEREREKKRKRERNIDVKH